MAAECYLQAGGGVRLTRHAWRCSIEPAIWCYRRAGEYDEAIQWIRKYMKYLQQTEFKNEEILGMSREICAMAHQEIGTHLIHMFRKNPNRTDYLEQAAQEFHSAGTIRMEQYDRSRFAHWALELANAVKENDHCDLEPRINCAPADILLMHNHYDALAADLVREQYEKVGLTCTDSGPQDSRSADELEAEYRTLVVFGSTAAPQLERFTYIFREMHGVWQLNPYLNDREPFYGCWRRPKTTGQGEWILLGGTRRVDTILAAGAFARRFAVLDDLPPVASPTQPR
ncbi:MAG: hypothetical protein HQ582_02430 [Planctomycetes bacterium]|nr:hypothetical protein [Planctomycetota bacterium]